MSTMNNFSSADEVSEEDEDGGAGGDFVLPEQQGTLSKWTNYIHGWQDRYFALKDGTLVYYKSEHESNFGCRGAISISKATVKSHELDELRFDVSVSSDCVWYLRAGSVEDRAKWIDTLEAYKQKQQRQDQDLLLRRHDSALSLTSSSTGNSKQPRRYYVNGMTTGLNLKEKLSEMETFRDLCCKQIDNLQTVFDFFAENDRETQMKEHYQFISHTNSHLGGSGYGSGSNASPVIDFKGEAITFKATTAGIMATLSHCIDLINQQEEYWRKKLEKEQITRKRIEEKYKHAIEVATEVTTEQHSKMVLVGGPEFEEGPHSQIAEDEFYDAVEDALDKLQEEQNYRDKLKLMSEKQMQHVSISEESDTHPLWSTVQRVTKEQLHYARLPVGDIWELFVEDGELKMYKREEEIDGMVVDPLKAVHQVSGVTARELCHYFFAPEFRQEWEATVEQATVLEKISDDTLIFLQLHKRLWPATQRDSLFWSHREHVKDIKEDGHSDTWLVCNQSTKHPDAPENKSGNCLRLDLTVIFVCDTTIIDCKSLDDPNLSRNDISCKITYCSVVNPGGWVPATALRAVYKREYPKFLKRFTRYVINKTKDKPLMW